MRLEIIVGHRFHIPFRYKLSHSFFKGIKPVTGMDKYIVKMDENCSPTPNGCGVLQLQP